MNDAGFTLIELMIVLVIVAIFLMIAAPSFYTTIKGNRLRTEADRLVTSLNLARSEAVKRNIDVVLCASSDGATCTGTLGQGWLIFADLNQDEALDNTDIIVKVYEAVQSGYTISQTDGSAYPATNIVYYPNGSSNSPQALQLCPTDKDAAAAWEVTVNAVGRVSASQGGNTCPA